MNKAGNEKDILRVQQNTIKNSGGKYIFRINRRVRLEVCDIKIAGKNERLDVNIVQFQLLFFFNLSFNFLKANFLNCFFFETFERLTSLHNLNLRDKPKIFSKISLTVVKTLSSRFADDLELNYIP